MNYPWLRCNGSDSDDDLDGADGPPPARSNRLLSACQPGKDPTVDDLQAIVHAEGFDPKEVPCCVGRCLEDGNVGCARFLIDHFQVCVNEPVPYWVLQGRWKEERQHLFSIAIFENKSARFLLGYPELDVNIRIRYITSNFTAAGALVRILLLSNRVSIEDDLKTLQMLLARDGVDVSEVWEVLFCHGLKGGSLWGNNANPRFFPLLRFLGDHPKTAPVLNERIAGSNETIEGTPFFRHLSQLCDPPKPQALLSILDALPQLSLAGSNAAGETVLHRVWRLGPEVVAKILSRGTDANADHRNAEGATVLDQVSDLAYRTGDATAIKTESLLRDAGAACSPTPMLTVTLAASPGFEIQVRAAELRWLSSVVDTFCSTAYTSAGSSSARQDFSFENLCAEAFQRLLDVFVLRRCVQGAGRTLQPRRAQLVENPEEDAAMLAELIDAADQYLMEPVQAVLRRDVERWQAGGGGRAPVEMARVVSEERLLRLFPRWYFDGKQGPRVAQELVERGEWWKAAAAVAESVRAGWFEAEELLGGEWEGAARGLGRGGGVSFQADGTCTVLGTRFAYSVREESAETGEEGSKRVALVLEGGGGFRLRGRDQDWAPVLVQRQCGEGEFEVRRVHRPSDEESAAARRRAGAAAATPAGVPRCEHEIELQ